MSAVSQPTLPQPPADAWASSDPLGETLHALRMTGVIYSRSHLTAPWGVSLPPLEGCLLFHVVTDGECVLDIPGREPVAVRPGEFVLLPRGEGHSVLNRPGVRVENLFDLPIERVSERYEILTYGGGGESTTLICGAVRFEHPAARNLVSVLPELIHIRTWNTPHADWMHSTLRLMAAELTAQHPGGESIVTRLADILVIQAIRAWLIEHPEQRTGWLAAVYDERIGPALVAIHKEPTRHWTVEDLAAKASLSRSAFAARFTEIVGQSPAQYLTHWRMTLACDWLLEDRTTIAECADTLGYQSEAAFHKAFKRIVGMPPGAWRLAAREDRDRMNGHPKS